MRRKTPYLTPHTLPVPPIGLAYSGLGGAGIRNANDFAAGSTTAGIHEAVADLPATGGIVWKPPGSYDYSQNIVIARQNVGLIGAGREATRLNFTGAGIAIDVGAAVGQFENIRLHDFQLDGGAAVTDGIRLRNAPDCEISGLWMYPSSRWSGAGIRLANSHRTKINHCYLRYLTHGVVLENVCHAMEIQFVLAAVMTGRGFHIGSVGNCVGVNLLHCDASQCEDHGVYFDYAISSSVKDSYFEDGGSMVAGDYFVVYSANAGVENVVDHCYFNGSDVLNYAIAIAGGSKPEITNNYFVNLNTAAIWNSAPAGINSQVRAWGNHCYNVPQLMGFSGVAQKRGTVWNTPARLIHDPLTSASWDGDSYSSLDADLDLSAVFGCPDEITAVLLNISCRDSGSAAGGNIGVWFCEADQAPNLAQDPGVRLDGQLNDAFVTAQLWVPCSKGGDIAIDLNASGVDTLDIYMTVQGYCFGNPTAN